MNYEDEDYVRYFTRDTVSWMALGWEGQAVLALMLHGKFDRSGVFDCDGHTPSHAVTLVTRMPEAVVEAGLGRLFKSKTWVHRDGKIVWPKFVEAQNCRRSDKARQRESRENRRREALGHEVTDRDQPSQPVTRGHTESQPVTPSLAEQSRAEDPPTPLSAVTETAPRDRFAESLSGGLPRQRADVRELHSVWAETFKRDGSTLGLGWANGDAEILAARIDASGLADCLLVCRFAPNDGKVSGRTDEHKDPHESIRYIFGNDETFSRILRDAKREAEKKSGISPTEKIRRASELR